MTSLPNKGTANSDVPYLHHFTDMSAAMNTEKHQTLICIFNISGCFPEIYFNDK